MSRLPFSHIIIPKSEADISPLWGCFTTILCFVAVMLTLCLLTGCKTEYVPFETVHHEYHHTSDTIRERDSIFNEKETIIRETNSGDSAMLAKLGIQLSEGQKAILILRKELERLKNEKYEAVHDTVIKNDTIRVPYPVEKKLGFWEKATIGSVGFVAALLTCGIAGVALWIRRRYKRM